MRKLVSVLIVLFGTLGGNHMYGSHNLAGQITAEYLGNNTYKITLTTYTDPAPAGVDRCSADIEIWSVGANQTLITTIQKIPRANGLIVGNPGSECEISNPRNGVPIYGTVKKNIYETTFTFPGPGIYELRYFDVARREDVKNMNNPGDTAFYVETQIFLPNPIIGTNNTPILLNDPLDEACTGKLWSHNPGGFDADGDSLSFELMESQQYNPPDKPRPTSVDNYKFPDSPDFVSNGPLTMDPVTGLMRWETPGQIGTYNIAYKVSEYRNGVLLGYVIRDMAIFVKACNNNPPIIETIEDTCVTAGDLLSFEVTSYDPDFPDSLYVELNNAGIGQNGPFSEDLANPADIAGIIFDPVNGNFGWSDLPVTTRNNLVSIDTVKGTVEWNTVCDNIRTQEYQVDFFAHDNDSYITTPNNVRLSANKVVRIRVIPPPPEMLTVTKASRSIQLDWMPSSCDNALGYRIYRSLGNPMWMQDTMCCDQSPEESGFELLGYQEGWANTSFVDSLTDVSNVFNQEFCYVITAMYGDVKAPNIPIIESCATETVCVNIKNDALYLTHATVQATDDTEGKVMLKWSTPDTIDSFFPPPYSYQLYKGDQDQPAETELVVLPFSDTTYVDSLINTQVQGYNYRVELLDANNSLVATSNGNNEGSSIFLKTNGGNRTITLAWSEFVSWTNTKYRIFRSEDGSGFSLLDSVNATGANTHNFIDAGLDPDIEYCYYIQSLGSHNVPGIEPLLINDSQIACSIAQDTFPPCNPMVRVSGDCNTSTHSVTVSKLLDVCESDGSEIKVFFQGNQSNTMELIETIAYDAFGQDTTLLIDRANSDFFAVCYKVLAIDTLGNESVLSEGFCVDFCPGLQMGNVFSPNSDNINDYFTPVFYRDVALREFYIFDRWGRKMHTNTTDLEILWDGSFNGKEASDGVYYYYIKYEELGLDGNEEREEKGWVTLIR